MVRLSISTLILALAAQAFAGEEYVAFHENILGTSLELRLRADSAGAAGRGEDRVLAEIDRLARIFSGYDPTSEFARWQGSTGTPTALSPELFDLLGASDRWRELSGGAFDPRVEILTRLWAASAKQDRLPTTEELAAALDRLGRPAWVLEDESRTARRLGDTPLTLNAIAKGFLVGRACEAALRPGSGVTGVLVNLGGDLRVAGEMSTRIGVADPRRDSESTPPIALIQVGGGRSVASSGGYQRGLRIRGKWYSHIFDPRTGLPADGVLGATVVSADAADADALATTLCVLPVAEGLRLADSLPGVACLIMTAGGKVETNARWAEVARPLPAPAAPRPANGPRDDDRPAWDDAFELMVSFEINDADMGVRGYRRPYIAIWIEDEEERPVRTLTLWIKGNGLRWLSDLKRWYREDKARKQADDTDLVATISRATRAPGQYQVLWDGKDDQGQPVKQGRYTLCIEAARERGTYQIIRKPLTLADQPLAEELKGNVEIKSAALEYRRRVVDKP